MRSQVFDGRMAQVNCLPSDLDRQRDLPDPLLLIESKIGENAFLQLASIRETISG